MVIVNIIIIIICHHELKYNISLYSSPSLKILEKDNKIGKNKKLKRIRKICRFLVPFYENLKIFRKDI